MKDKIIELLFIVGLSLLTLSTLIMTIVVTILIFI